MFELLSLLSAYDIKVALFVGVLGVGYCWAVVRGWL